MFTLQVCFAADALTYLKLIEAGVPKEQLGLLAVPLAPLQILIPLLISKYTNGPRPLDFFIKAIPFRLFTGLVVAGFVYATPMFKDANNEFPFYYYVLCLLINMVSSVFSYSMFVSQMSFFAQISDKGIGGTYMTLLNTLSNLGSNWPNTVALYSATYLTFKYCSSESLPSELTPNATNYDAIKNNTCFSDLDQKVMHMLHSQSLIFLFWVFIFEVLATTTFTEV